MAAANFSQNLLIVGDDPSRLEVLSDAFKDEGVHVLTCVNLDEAKQCCEDQNVAVAILAKEVSGEDHTEVVSALNEKQPGIRIIRSNGSDMEEPKSREPRSVESFDDQTELIKLVHQALKEQLSSALTESEQRYRELLDDVSAIVWECDLPSWQFTFVSQQAETILGFPVSKWLNEPDFWVNCIHPDDRERSVNFCRHSSSHGEDHEFEYRAIAADGRIVWLNDVVHVVKDELQTPIKLRGVMFDITKRKNSEDQLRRMKMQLAHISSLSTMGEMVAGIAHEINQPLSAIANYALASKNTIVKKDYKDSAQIQTWLDEINQQAVRCGDIIRRLGKFANTGSDGREMIDLNRIVAESAAVVSSDIRLPPERIKCHPSSPELLVYANPIQLQQVVVNLIRNACDATKEMQSPEIDVYIHAEGDRVGITVEDNGSGVEESARQLIFDAFYTTKTDGIGMGLAISKSIIEAHDGSLRIDSGNEHRTRFHIELPRPVGNNSTE